MLDINKRTKRIKITLIYKKIELTLFKICLAFAPKRSIRSVPSNNPRAVIKSIFSTGINATRNRSRNPIASFFTELKMNFSNTPSQKHVK